MITKKAMEKARSRHNQNTAMNLRFLVDNFLLLFIIKFLFEAKNVRFVLL